MAETFDIVIVGGGVMGCSTAYHLTKDGRAGRVAVVERDPTYEYASTPRSAGGIRQQFSLPENIRMSQYGLGFYKRFGELMAVDDHIPEVGLKQQGYLFLATEGGAETLRACHRTQRGLDAPVLLLDRAGLAARYPSMVLDDIVLGSLGPEDGWMDPFAILQGFRRKARALGATFIADAVVDVERQGRRATGVRLQSGGTLAAGAIVNAAGPWAGEVARLVGMNLPVEPVRRMVHYFEVKAKLEPFPLVIDPSGLYFRPEGAGYISGRSNLEEPAGANFEVDHDYFMDVIWPGLAARVPAFEALKPGRSWAGLYDVNRLDENLIIGPWTGALDNFHVICGFSGHGLQQAPAAGRALSELLLDGAFKSIDLTRMTYARVAQGRPLPEVGIV